ncbi:SNF2-related protein [Cupriavidus necator]|uniref:SNF2-related protein n=1 Tax=Cupriavidus necator TaxID=106590 RepID=UPI003ECEBCDA
MGLNIHAGRWRFLGKGKAERYIARYEQLREEGRKTLAPATTRRQFATAKAILDRMHAGQKGVILADDVGLGKTTVAALCALVFAGSGKRVRILAPNEMMGRRWRQELEVHIHAIAAFAPHLDLTSAKRRLGVGIERLHPGAIAVSTHQKAGQLSCDLLIVDEAHRTRSESSNLGRQIASQGKSVGNVLILTATPFSIDPNDLARLLKRVGGAQAAKPMKDYARMLANLWRGRRASGPKETADQLVATARSAVEAMRPYLIRHGIDDLARVERKVFGTVEDASTQESTEVSAGLLDAMLRADRALLLAQRCGAWEIKRRNDPRYHVAVGMLSADLTGLLNAITQSESSDATAASFAAHHGTAALAQLRTVGIHPKIADTIGTVQAIVDQGEKVLIFCDHHQPATELAAALAQAIRWPMRRERETANAAEAWLGCWRRVFADEIAKARNAGDGGKKANRLEHYIAWLASPGVQAQIGEWLALACPPDDMRRLAELVAKTKARGQKACDFIASHAKELYRQLIDTESGSTRAILLQGEPHRLPGATAARVAAVCDPRGSVSEADLPGVFFTGQPDTVLAIFNSPFGPDVLVATDSLSEGVDLHRFCRHLVHHELDPSPIRTIQRNGRLRRVNCWAARTGKPIRIFYPALRGTRDERLVEVMRHRILQFDLLLGGVRADVDSEDVPADPKEVGEILKFARERLGTIRLGIMQSER